jgi:Rrf2 family protein
MRLLKSRQGKGGGYLLAKDPEQIQVGQIVRTFNGPLALVPCVSVTAFGKCEECIDFDHCGVRRVMKKVRDVTADILDGTSLAALVAIEASESDEAALMFFI